MALDYDTWKTTDMSLEADGECPECGAPTLVDNHEKSEDCTECEWGIEFDWDDERDNREAERMGWG